jgi:hypothetical protein
VREGVVSVTVRSGGPVKDEEETEAELGCVVWEGEGRSRELGDRDPAEGPVWRKLNFRLRGLEPSDVEEEGEATEGESSSSIELS